MTKKLHALQDKYVGKRFGRLTVIRLAHRHQPSGKTILLCVCRCDCGKLHRTKAWKLAAGVTRSCGCVWREKAKAICREYIGQRFGKLVVTGISRRRTKEGHACAHTLCDCGRTKCTPLQSLRHAHVKSCGCLQHGYSHLPEYGVWKAMLKRCEYSRHPNFTRYGGRGIHVCAEWHKFQNFVAYLRATIGLRPASPRGWRRKHPYSFWSLDRINPDRGYFPGNIRCATPQQQAQNRRRSSVSLPLAA